MESNATALDLPQALVSQTPQTGAIVVHHAFLEDAPLGPDGQSVAAVTELLTMGRGDQGQLMTDEEFRPNPQPVLGLSVRAAGQLVQVAASTFHTAVITNQGELFIAGNNDDGQIAADSDESRITRPRTIGALESQRIVSVAAGDSHTACVNGDGKVLTFGSNELGQLGHASSSEGDAELSVYRRPPRLMRGVERVRAVQVACGENFTVVLGAAGDVYTVGSGAQGCLGLGSTSGRSQAERVTALMGTPCTQIAAGSVHVVAVTVTGLAYSWGRNKHGRLGLSLKQVPHAAHSPRRVTALPELVQQVACGDDHTAFVSRTGRVFMAGNGSRGQLGLALPAGHGSAVGSPGDATGANTDASPARGSIPGTRHPLAAVETPTRVEALEGFPVRQAACGRGFTMLLLQDGSVLACGANEAGQTGLLAPEEQPSSSTSSSSSSAAAAAAGEETPGGGGSGSEEHSAELSAADAAGATAAAEQAMHAEARARAHPASAASLGVAPPFRPTDVPLPARVPSLSGRGVFSIEAGSEHAAAIRVVAGSVLSTPPGSMPRGSMAFIDAATMVTACGWGASRADSGPLLRTVADVFGDVSALNGSFLSSAPEDLKLIEVRAPGAPSLVRRLARGLPGRFPRILDGAGAAIREGGAPSSAASRVRVAEASGTASPRDAGGSPSELPRAAIGYSGASPSDSPPPTPPAALSSSSGNAATGLASIASAGAAFSLSGDDVDDEPPRRAVSHSLPTLPPAVSSDRAAEASADVGTIDVVGRATSMFASSQGEHEASSSSSLASAAGAGAGRPITSVPSQQGDTSSLGLAEIGSGSGSGSGSPLDAPAVTARNASVGSLVSEPAPPATYPLHPVDPAAASAGGKSCTDCVAASDPRACEVAVARAGGPFPPPRVVVMFPEFRVVPGTVPFPAEAAVRDRLDTSGIHVEGLETAYRAMFARLPAMAGRAEPDAPAATGSDPRQADLPHPSSPSSSAAAAAAAAAAPGRVAGPSSSSSSSSSSAAGLAQTPADPFAPDAEPASHTGSAATSSALAARRTVIVAFYRAVTSMLSDVRPFLAGMAEPEAPRFLLVLLLCPLLGDVDTRSAEVVARVCEAVLAVPVSTRGLLLRWIGRDLPPTLFASRVLRTLHAHLNAFVKLSATGRAGAAVCPGITNQRAMEMTARCLGALYAVNEKLAAENRAQAATGKPSGPRPEAAAAGADLAAHLASSSGPPSSGVFGMGLLDPATVVGSAGAGASAAGPGIEAAAGARSPAQAGGEQPPASPAAAAVVAQIIRGSSAGSSAAAPSPASSDAASHGGAAAASSAAAARPSSGHGSSSVLLAPGVTFMSGIDEDVEVDGVHRIASPPSGHDDDFGRIQARVAAWLDDGHGSGSGSFAATAASRPLSAEELEHTAWGLVHFSAFYNSTLSDLPDPVLRMHYDAWRLRGFRVDPAELNLCATPFLLSAAAKRRVLAYEAQLQQTQQAHNAMARAMFFGGGSPYLVLQVRREHLLGDALSFLNQQHPHTLKKPLRVVFVGEDGVDAGGVTREFFQLTTEALTDPMLAMFARLPSGEYSLSPNSLESDTEFRLAGLVCGLAIYNNVVLDLPLALFLYRKLLGEALDVFDLTAAMPELGRGLQQLLRYEGDDVEDIFCLDFTVTKEAYGAKTTVELVEGGSDKPVTSGNRAEYVDALVRYHLGSAVERQFAAFAKGFLSVADGPALHLFRAEELSKLVSGQGYLDYDALRRATVYEGGFSADHPAVKAFWSVVRAMTDEQRRKLLLFATGASRAPIGGLAKLDPPFKLQRNGPDSDRLPTASTCFHTLLLPEYASEAKLRRLLLASIEECRGFGLQ